VKQMKSLAKTGTVKKKPVKKKGDRETRVSKPRSIRKIQSEFITSMSHQFRTPLATFQSSVELLEYYCASGNEERQHETFRKIKRTLSYLNATIENITSLYKYSSARARLQFQNIDLRKFVGDLLDELVFSISNTHLLQFYIQPDLKEINGDEFVLKQILLNLIHNAIKFSPEGGQIKLDIQKTGRQIEFVVRDEGIGIDKTDLKKIFSPFIRGKNVTLIQGAGLGLSIVKNLVRLHKGKIYCESKLNEGTTFRVKIPAGQLQ
jgi:signal transduction histidine kinase